ncbi:MAG: helix-turn-helix transcriptional regulator [Rhizobiaceae bacterium]|nr:helix-turn-helix transcriptional regulator [Rhizobiaceae bacterium]
MPLEAEQLSDLIGRIYDASLDPELWPAVLEKLCAFVPGSAANLFSQDALDRTADRYFSCGYDPGYEALYLEKYAAVSPFFPATVFFPVGEVFRLDDILPHSELQATRFYREWMEPQGYVDAIWCNLDKTATSAAPFVVARHRRDGLVDEETQRRMRLIAPHVRRAILIGKVINLKSVEATALADTLDTLAAAVFLVDADGRVIHANAAGHSLVAARVALEAPGARLAATDPQARQALHESVISAAAGDAALGTKGISLSLPGRDGHDYVAQVLPLTSASRRQANTAYGATAAVFVHKAVLDLQSPLETVTRRYRLTAGELRVLVALLNLGSVSEVADVLGISEGTVRNHLHRLFEKTGTSRQAELVKLVGGFGSPLVS